MLRPARAELLSAVVLPIGIVLALQGEIARPASQEVAPAGGAVSFAEQVQPIFQARCSECHGGVDEATGEQTLELGLNLTTYEGVMAGSDYGTVVEPGNPGASLLVEMIRAGDMPEEGDPVPPDEIEIISTWIAEGAQNN